MNFGISQVGSPPPLVVDLDGTLVKTDTLFEALLKLVKSDPLKLFSLVAKLFVGLAAFKSEVAKQVSIDLGTLPYNQNLIAYLEEQKRVGRALVLATASHQSVADSVATQLGLFDRAIGSDNAVNLKGRCKLSAINEQIGDRFSYAGDSSSDLAIWRAAESAVLVGASSKTANAVRKITPIEKEFARESFQMTDWIRAFRVHQWLKNFLVFVPLLTSFSFFDHSHLAEAVLAFFAFSILASGTYMLNDLFDIESDRRHPRKKNRPFAAGRIPIIQGIFLAAVLVLAGIAISTAVSKYFVTILLCYLFLTSLYSWKLKAYAVVDVILLAMLYTIRILAGAITINVDVSCWLLAFAVLIFISLALIKRCSELLAVRDGGKEGAVGRGYSVSDLTVLWPMGTSSAMASVVVLGLFISAPETITRYRTPELLWGAAIALIYWILRLWIKTSRGEMHDDPIIYAAKNKNSLAVLSFIVVVVMLAHYVDFRSLLA